LSGLAFPRKICDLIVLKLLCQLNTPESRVKKTSRKSRPSGENTQDYNAPTPVAGDLQGQSLSQVFAEAKAAHSEPEELGQTMYRWFTENGGIAFLVAGDELHLTWKGQRLQIGLDSFKTFLLNEAGITSRTPKANRIIEAFRLRAAVDAKRSGNRSWFKTDRANRVVYLHMNAADGLLFRVSPDRIDRLENGSKVHDVLLFPSPKIAEWDYAALTPKNYKLALKLFGEIVLTRLACSPENQLLYGCWLLAYPLMGFSSSHPHLRCEGSSGRGKTRAMDIMSTFVYASSKIKTATDAANYTDAAQNPLLFIDNIETRNLTPELVQFMLTVVSGIERERRLPGTARGTVVEELHSLLNTSGIENLDRIELLNRTFHIEFDHKKFGMPLWSDTYYHMIRMERSKMMSAHVKLVAKVLEMIQQKEHEKWRQWIQSEYPNHILGRSNEYLAIMALIAEQILPVLYPRMRVQDLVGSWISSQEAYVGAVAVEANPIVAAIEAVFREAEAFHVNRTAGRWPYDIPCDGKVLSGSSSPLRSMLAKIATKNHLAFDYKSANTFSRRLKDSEAILNDAGYALQVTFDNHKKHFKYSISKLASSPKGMWAASEVSDRPNRRRRS